MTPQLKNWVNQVRLKYLVPTPSRILEIGSFNVNGKVRDLFGDSDYTGIDLQPGPDVDIVMNGHDAFIVFGANSFDLILCLDTLEHDIEPYKTILGMQHMVKSGGHMIVSVPTSGFPEHRHPKDYWRFMKDTFYDIIFIQDAFLMLDFVEIQHEGLPGLPGLAAIGRKK